MKPPKIIRQIINKLEKAKFSDDQTYSRLPLLKASLMPMAGSGGIGNFLIRLGYNRLRIFLDSSEVAMSLPNSLAILTTLSTN